MNEVKKDEVLSEVKQAENMIKDVYESREATINGRTYTFFKSNHKQRKIVFAYYCKIKNMIVNEDISFIADESFEPVERIINEIVGFEGMTLSKLRDHWENEEHARDYMIFISTAMAVISYPFLAGNVGN